MDDTWAPRDLPVLEAVVELFDEMYVAGELPDVADIAARASLPAAAVGTALGALDGDYIKLQTTMGDPSSWFISGVTSEARRAVGQWPTGEVLIERLATGIAQAARQETDSEQKRRLLAVARELGGAVKSIAVNVASEILEHRLPR